MRTQYAAQQGGSHFAASPATAIEGHLPAGRQYLKIQYSRYENLPIKENQDIENMAVK